MSPKFPKEIYFVAGLWKNRLYSSRGHVKQALKYNKDHQVYKLDFHVGSWVDITEEFK